jgi:hypothetical protein
MTRNKIDKTIDEERPEACLSGEDDLFSAKRDNPLWIAEIS